MNWIDRVPTSVLIVAAVILGLAPFVPEPHLWQKLKMLAAGELSKPIDIFDLFLHGAPVLLLLIKWGRSATRRHQSGDDAGS
ncbi:MAG: RND transporter [Thiotrichales bacterium SG8_50]|nr:MAG: RND transporter [Thiotrichales bacterium SG8_50]